MSDFLSTNQATNVAKPYTGNYIGKYPAQLGNGTVNLETTGAWALTTQGIDGKYAIDISANMKTWMQDDTPLLTLMMNLPAQSSMGGPYCVWNDEYKGTSWFDALLDHLRTVDNTGAAWTVGNSAFGDQVAASENGMAYVGDAPYSADNSSYTGGQMMINAVSPAPTSSALGIVSSGKNCTVASNAILWLGVNQSTSLQGHVNTVWNAIRQRLAACGYTMATTEVSTTVGETTTVLGTAYTVTYSTSGLPVYFAFDTMVWTDTSASAVKISFEVMARIQEVRYQIKASDNSVALFFKLDFTDSNLYGEVVATDVVYTGYHANAGLHQTCISRMFYVGQSTTAPGAIPEGDNFRKGGGVTSYRENKTNNCQIFQSDAYGITGTYAASKFKFGDDFADTRAFHMMKYKRQKNAAYWFGMKGETTVTSTNAFMNGQPARTTGGFLDYALFPINYIYAPLTSLNWVGGVDVESGTDSSTYVIAMENWLERIGERLMAFKQGGSRNLTIACSLKMVRKLTKYNRILAINKMFAGGEIQTTAPSAINFGIETMTYKTAHNTIINFVHEPALDYMTKWPLPQWIFNTNKANPQDIMFSIDTANIAECVHRPDKIEGNIQDVGQDAFLEGMRGESGFILRYPKNHAVIYAPAS